jgi:hypothetical protein
MIRGGSGCHSERGEEPCSLIVIPSAVRNLLLHDLTVILSEAKDLLLQTRLENYAA